jgi:hypothetical protein
VFAYYSCNLVGCSRVLKDFYLPGIDFGSARCVTPWLDLFRLRRDMHTPGPSRAVNARNPLKYLPNALLGTNQSSRQMVPGDVLRARFTESTACSCRRAPSLSAGVSLIRLRRSKFALSGTFCQIAMTIWALQVFSRPCVCMGRFR